MNDLPDHTAHDYFFSGYLVFEEAKHRFFLRQLNVSIPEILQIFEDFQMTMFEGYLQILDQPS